MKSESAKGMNELISEERHRLTLEALADVDSGNVIDRQAIQAWAVSLETDSPLPVPEDRRSPKFRRPL